MTDAPGNADPIRQILSELFASQKLGVLGTHSDGQPHASLVAFAASDDLKTLLFATRRPTQKYANIMADARVSMLIDSRSAQDVDFQECVAVTAMGAAAEVDQDEMESLAALYLGRHPNLRQFLALPPTALMKIDVASYHVVSQFEEVTDWPVPR